jgi:valyl-tRNA synthetase
VRLNTLVRDVQRLFDTYQYGEAGRQIYDFFWSEFADWYVEIAKLQMTEGGDRAFYTAQQLVHTLDTCLRLLHPFTPFITEELWGHLKRAALEHSPQVQPQGGWEEALIIARWPESQSASEQDDQIISDFSLVMEVVRSLRNLRTEKKVEPGKRIPATIVAGDRYVVLQSQINTVTALAHLDPSQTQLVAALEEKPQGQISLVILGVEIYLPLAGLVDTAAEAARLKKELEETQSQINRLQGLLSSPFAEKAPPAVVENERKKLATFIETAEKLKEQLKNL